MSLTVPLQMPEPCSRLYLHRPHLIQVVGLSNTVMDLICPGTEAGR